MNRDVECDAQVSSAEQEMFAEVLYELFLGVLAGGNPAPWFETAAWRLSRGSSPKLLETLQLAHAAGARMEPRAVALCEAIESLLLAERQPAATYGFPSELAVLVVSRESAAEMLERVRAGLYSSTDDVFSSAIFALGWTENHPLGRVELLKHAVRKGSEDADAGRVIPAEEVFRRARERLGG